MQLSQIIGQSPVKAHLCELLQQNRLSHALLFAGREGSGALPLAIAFAQLLVCEKVNGLFTAQQSPSLFGEVLTATPTTITDSCGVCPACIKAGQLAHPDIHFSYPVISKKQADKDRPAISVDYIKDWREFLQQTPYGNVYDWLQSLNAENKQGNISAHECNDIIRKLNLKSFESEYKILIMWMPEYLGNEGNKLLKLIEEPPPNTLFVLVAENESLVLQTILSRCQLVKIPALETKEIEEALIRRHKTESGIARQVAGVSEGNYRDAMQLVQHA